MKILYIVLLLIGSAQAQLLVMGKPPAASGSAPTYQTASAGTNASSTSCTPGEPSGTANGDLLLGMAVFSFTNAGTTPALPASWTSLYSGTAGTVYKFAVGYIKRGGSAAATNFVNGTDAAYNECYIVRISGSNATPIDSQSSSGSISATTATPNAPATTATAACNTSLCLAVTGGIHWTGSSGTGWAVSGYTIRSTNTAGMDMFLAVGNGAVSAGSIDPAQSTSNGSTTVTSDQAWNGFTVTVKP